MIKLKYFYVTGELRDAEGGWDGDTGYEFEYSVSKEEAVKVIADEVIKTYMPKVYQNKGQGNYDIVFEGVKKFISDLTELDVMVEYFEDELKAHFEQEAMESQR